MAKLSAQEKYEKLQIKKIHLTEKLERLKTELVKTEEDLEYAEFLAWKEEKKVRNKIVVVDGAAADAESDNEIITEALMNDGGRENEEADHS